MLFRYGLLTFSQVVYIETLYEKRRIEGTANFLPYYDFSSIIFPLTPDRKRILVIFFPTILIFQKSLYVNLLPRFGEGAGDQLWTPAPSQVFSLFLLYSNSLKPIFSLINKVYQHPGFALPKYHIIGLLTTILGCQKFMFITRNHK